MSTAREARTRKAWDEREALHEQARAPRPADAVFALQRTAGNQAVTALLAPGRRSMSREPVETADAPATGPIPREDPHAWLDMEGIRDETKAEILVAFSVFLDACDANVTAMKAAAKAEGEMAALAVDIVGGFLAPAFAVVAGPTVLGRLTLKLSEKMVVPQPDEALKELINSTDLLKAGFTGATKVVSDQLKRNSTPLFGEGPDDAFLDEFKTIFQANAVKLVGRVHNMSDNELFSVWTAYDAEVANITTYKETIRILLDQFHAIQSIGSHPGAGNQGPIPISWSTMRLYRVVEPDGAEHIAVLEDETSMFFSHLHFRSWIPAHLEPLAIAQQREALGTEPVLITPDEIEGDVPPPL